jgi:hypothetical protein
MQKLEVTTIAQAISYATQLTIPEGGVTGSQISYAYASLAGNQPASDGDTLFLWQTADTSIPLGTPPLDTFAIPTNTPNGTGVFQGLSVTTDSYLLAMAVGPDPTKNICSTVFVPAGLGAAPIVSTPSVVVTVIGSTSLAFHYTLPPGCLPNSDGDWAGVWEGQTPSVLYTRPPAAFAPIEVDDSTGDGAINDIALRRGTAYTVGYFKGGYATPAPKQTTLACAYTFVT